MNSIYSIVRILSLSLMFLLSGGWGSCDDLVDGKIIGGEHDGMRIIFSEVTTEDPSKPQLFIEIENANEQAAIFIDEGTAYRLLFTMQDRQGKEIMPNDDWWRGDDPKPEGIRIVNSEIPPGGRVGYYLDLVRAYGEAWSKGSKLLVTWNPGYREGAAPNIFGWGLKAEYDMRPLVRKTFPNAFPDSEPGEKGDGQTPQTPRKSPEEIAPSLPKETPVEVGAGAKNGLRASPTEGLPVPLVVAAASVLLILVFLILRTRGFGGRVDKE